MSSAAWPTTVDNAIALRQRLHRQPELAWQEQQTAAAIRAELDRLQIPWRVCAETGTVGQLAAGRPGRHLALRADIDALPIQEATGLDFASEVPGLMHACGHDGHTATLIATASWLKRHEDALPGPVSLLFQPAEEGGHGAERMVEDGALAGCDAIFGWHNWPAIPFGKAVCPDGTVMCANGTFDIVVDGSGGHASQPECCADPVLAASAITLALQQIVSRRLPPQAAAVVGVSSIIAKSSYTIIPPQARLRGSIRAADLPLRQRLQDLISEISAATAAAYGVSARIEHRPRYGPTVNQPEAAAEYRRALAAELGEDWRDQAIALPIMASEDFSYYLQTIPGAFALIGAGVGGASPPCHSPHYRFNDDLIDLVGRLFLRLANCASLPVS